MGRALRANTWAGGVLALLAASCGELVSWDERWILDGTGHSSPAPSGAPASPPACEAEPFEGYRYADPPEHWLGSYEAFDVSVSGLGYLAAEGESGDPSERRFWRAAALEVAADGTIVVGDEPMLGYARGATPGQCVVELRAPMASPPRPTTFVDLIVNFDPRSRVTTFDTLEPLSTSLGSISFSVIDSLGVSRVLDLYYSHLDRGLIEYHVLADGAAVAGGVPGTLVDVGHGILQFDENGALLEPMTQTFLVSFAGGADPNQHIALGWGSRQDWADGSRRDSTYLPDSNEVYSISINGFRPGAGVGICVEAAGDVVAYYDSGEALTIGTLALARFSRESELAPVADGSAPTPESGGPLYGAPLSGGRGAILIGAPPR